MGTRTVRLEEETEERLAEIRRDTGLTISEVLKLGVRSAYAELVRESKGPWEVYRALDLGPGGYAGRSASASKAAVKEVIGRKHRR